MTGHIDWDHQFSQHYGLDISLDGRFLSAVDNYEFVDYYDISKGIQHHSFTLHMTLF